MPRLINTHYVKAIICLKRNGFSFYAITKAFGKKDRRNLIELYERYKDKFLLPSKKVGKL